MRSLADLLKLGAVYRQVVETPDAPFAVRPARRRAGAAARGAAAAGAERGAPAVRRAADGRAGHLSAGRALGRLGGVRVEGVAEEGAERRYMLVPTTCFNCEAGCGLLAYVDQRDDAGPQVRGQPDASRAAAGATAPRARPRINQIYDPGAHPVPAEAGRAARRRASGSARPGTRCWTTSRAASAPRWSSSRHNEVVYHVGRPGEDGYMERVLPGVGHRRPQHPHQRLLGGRAARLRRLDGARTGPSPGPRQRALHPAAQLASGDRATTSTRTPSASWRRRWRARSSP